jgi:dTDP-4-dehydrorhamnose 3,5-epimerase
MIFEETKLKGAFVIRIEKIEDERGFFARAWCQKEFAAHGLNLQFVQANLAANRNKGTLRGMHYQVAPYQEAKLVRCTKGTLYDVIIDLRPDSATYGKWFGTELSAANNKMLYVPGNFAHGYQTLKNDTEAFYLVSAFYSPAHERGLRWNDPAFGIEWPVTEKVVISEKDQNWPDYLPLKGS